MTLADMRRSGVYSVSAYCRCGHWADVNVDRLVESLAVPEVRGRLRCSACGARPYQTRPAWHTQPVPMRY